MNTHVCNLSAEFLPEDGVAITQQVARESVTYTAEYKQRILEEAEAVAATRGGVGALLRREGLYCA